MHTFQQFQGLKRIMKYGPFRAKKPKKNWGEGWETIPAEIMPEEMQTLVKYSLFLLLGATPGSA